MLSLSSLSNAHRMLIKCSHWAHYQVWTQTLFKNLKYMYHKLDRPTVSGQFGKICFGGSQDHDFFWSWGWVGLWLTTGWALFSVPCNLQCNVSRYLWALLVSSSPHYWTLELGLVWQSLSYIDQWEDKTEKLDQWEERLINWPNHGLYTVNGAE